MNFDEMMSNIPGLSDADREKMRENPMYVTATPDSEVDPSAFAMNQGGGQ